MNELLAIGLVLVIIGIICIVIASLQQAPGTTHTGGVVFLGPIPLIFGSDQNTANMAMILGIILVTLSFLMFFWRNQ